RPALTAFDARIAAVDDRFAALLEALADQTLDARFAGGRYDRSHLDAIAQTVAHLEAGRDINDRIGKFLRGVAHRDGGRYREAALSCAAERTVADDSRAHVDIGVGHDDDIILCSALALHTLAVG